MLKLEDETNNTIIVEAQDVIDVANAWDTLYFDYSNATAGAVDLANTYDKASLFYDFNNSGTGTVFYWDNVEFAPLPLAQMDLPVTFDDATVDYGTIDFGGNVSAFVADPADASNNVVQSIKTTGSQTWAGTSLATLNSGGSEVGFANAIPFSSGDQSMSVRVWSPAVGMPIMMKVEDADERRCFVEAQDTITVVGAWETLVFDFGNPTNGTLDLANTYDKVSMFFNFNVSGANDTFYWDDVEFITSPPASVQMDLPVTFDDASVNYGVIAFEGAVSSIIVDPNDASNMLVQSEKTVGAQPWAGTSLAIRTQWKSDGLCQCDSIHGYRSAIIYSYGHHRQAFL